MPSNTISEIYDLDFLELDSSSSSSSSPVSSSPTNSVYSSNSSCFSDNNSNRPAKWSNVTQSTVCHKKDGLVKSAHEEPFTFQDFVSSIVNSEETIIIQDIARLLELKFRDFKKRTQINVYLDANAELFYKIGEQIFTLACQEPNGILGTRINLNLMLNNGKMQDICHFFSYDSKTFETSEITVTLVEDVTKHKKFLLKFFTSIADNLPIKVDSNNFSVEKRKLY